MNTKVKRDFGELEEAGDDCEAVIIGDLGAAFGYDVLNRAFRQVMNGAELIALQKNRYWMRSDGLSLESGRSSLRSSTRLIARRMSLASLRAGSLTRCSPSWG